MALYLLGRKLMQVAEEALPQGSAATSVRLVLIDAVYHPNSSITEITERTGFTQSVVSDAVARLRKVGVLETEPDRADRRRTVVRATPALREVGRSAEEFPIDDALAEALASEQEEEVGAALAALEVLARLLTPEVFDDDHEPTPFASQSRPSPRPISRSTNVKHNTQRSHS
ncbi:MAG: MarR family winged helix-turn-helix transcriptional regulator [Solirubrobacteraceae bacterium]